jgi:hypothetical protein
MRRALSMGNVNQCALTRASNVAARREGRTYNHEYTLVVFEIDDDDDGASKVRRWGVPKNDVLTRHDVDGFVVHDACEVFANHDS